MEYKTPLLSIVVPVSRMSGQLARLKEWLYEIDFKICEVILVHDVADDTTGAELELLVTGKKGKNLKLISGIWGNPGGPRNLGISESTGDWITFWDSDDSPCLENCISAILSNQNTEVHIGAFEIVESGTGRTKDRKIPGSLEDIYIYPGIWRFIFKRISLGEMKFPELSMGEDQVFLMKLNLIEKDKVFHSEIFYKYFSGVNNQLTSKKSAISDLSETFAITYYFYKKSSHNEKKFIGLMLMKQSTTIFKRSNFTEKIRTIPMIIGFLFTNPITFIQCGFKITRDIVGK